MPARSIRVTIHNQSQALTLIQQPGSGNPYFRHGTLTDGWGIPATVAPQQTIGFQAESDGVATGAEGWVTYLVQGPRPSTEQQGFVNIYWNIPYFTLGGHQDQYCIAKSSFEGFDTSGDYPEDVGGFSTNMDFAFGLQRLATDPSSGTGANTPGSIVVEAGLGGSSPELGIGIPFIGASLPQVFDSNPPHMYADVLLVDVQQGFQSQPVIFKPFVSPTSQDWLTVSESEFQSADGRTSVVIPTITPEGIATITLTDQGSSTSSALDLTESVDLHTRPPTHRLLTATSVKEIKSGASSGAASAKKVLEAEPIKQSSLVKGVKPQETATATSSRSAEQVGESLAAHPGNTVILPIQNQVGMDGTLVVLSLLVGTHPDGSAAGRAIEYQRFNALGAVVRDVILVYRPPPPR